jgi:hypothetical protein
MLLIHLGLEIDLYAVLPKGLNKTGVCGHFPNPRVSYSPAPVCPFDFHPALKSNSKAPGRSGQMIQ